MKFTLKPAKIILSLLIVASSIAGCDKSNLDSQAKQQETKSVAAKKIIVGTFSAIPNISYLDANGRITGYDIEVVREINRRLPQYEFDFVSMEFANLFLSLDTKKIDFIAMHLEKNPAREAKYLFNAEPYDASQTKVIVNDDRADIHSIDDLKNKNVIVSPGGNPAFLIEEFNKKNGSTVNVLYGSSFDDTVKQLKSGRVDATLLDTSLVKSLNERINARLKTVGPNLVGAGGIHFAFRKTESDLAADVDHALKQMKSDGSLNKLSKQWLNRDFE